MQQATMMTILMMHPKWILIKNTGKNVFYFTSTCSQLMKFTFVLGDRRHIWILSYSSSPPLLLPPSVASSYFIIIGVTIIWSGKKDGLSVFDTKGNILKAVNAKVSCTRMIFFYLNSHHIFWSAPAPMHRTWSMAQEHRAGLASPSAPSPPFPATFGSEGPCVPGMLFQWFTSQESGKQTRNHCADTVSYWNRSTAEPTLARDQYQTSWSLRASPALISHHCDVLIFMRCGR